MPLLVGLSCAAWSTNSPTPSGIRLDRRGHHRTHRAVGVGRVGASDGGTSVAAPVSALTRYPYLTQIRG